MYVKHKTKENIASKFIEIDLEIKSKNISFTREEAVKNGLYD